MGVIYNNYSKINKFRHYDVKIGSTVYWVHSDNQVLSGEYVGNYDDAYDIDIFVRYGRQEIFKFTINQVYENEKSCYEYLIEKKQKELTELENKAKYLARDIERLKESIDLIDGNFKPKR